jgi:hypothetical protein
MVIAMISMHVVQTAIDQVIQMAIMRDLKVMMILVLDIAGNLITGIWIR